jgi:uncharacterized protein
VSDRIIDLVGYGSANWFEGAATAAPSNTTAVLRKNAGAQDTDQNHEDFSVGAPTPRNTGNPVPPPPPVPVETTIAEVQGEGAESPLAGELVTVEGVVTTDFQGIGQYGGYFVQSVQGDGNDLTSEGLRVYDFRTPVAVGDKVRVTATVDEFASEDLYEGSETQLEGPVTVDKLGTAPLPTPVGLTLPFAATANGVHGQERYEGMLVTVPEGLVATDLFTYGRYGEIALTTDQKLRIPTNAAQNAANDADRITLDDGLDTQNPAQLAWTVDDQGTLPRAGDALGEPVTGAFSFARGLYRVVAPAGTTAGFDRLNPRTEAPDAVGGDVQVASFNVLNYFTEFGGANRGANNATELKRQEDKLVSAITALDADVVGLIEIANDGGKALDKLVALLNEAQSDPADDYTAVVAPALTTPSDVGGTYGTDAIRTAIIYRAAVVSPIGGPPSDAALLDPADPAFPKESLFDRPPAVQTFARVGDEREFTVLVNHLKSKGSTNDQCGKPDEFAGNCDDLRERQAAGLAALVEALGTDEALLLGDFNSYEDEAPIGVLEGAGYVSAADDLATADRYSYSFDGEFGTLDYIFASSGLAGALTGVDIWHVNSAEAPVYDYNTEFKAAQQGLYAPGPFASSDHDPVLVGLDLDVAPVADAGADQKTRVDRNATLDATGSTDRNGDSTLSFAWDLDRDGAFDDATGATVPFGAGLDPGRYTVAVQVSDGQSTDVDEALLTITTPKGVVPPGRP